MKTFCTNAVIGAGFGDEGKGQKVHKLTSMKPNSLVVRYSGGQQAGHTVFWSQSVAHVFSNFGSGTFNGSPTYWSKFCTFDPIGVVNELRVLENLGIKPRLLIDKNCPVTTPYEKVFNQGSDDFLVNGTCGVGVGQTYEREENFHSLTVGDLLFPTAHDFKLDNIFQWYRGLNYAIANKSKPRISAYKEACDIILNSDCFEIVDRMPYHFYDSICFEGSQGLLLDQHIGFFPNVTRSNVGTKNILDICSEYDLEPPVIHLMTRAYQTRHGNGPMTEQPIKIKNNNHETNKTNRWQGKFRTSMLDLDLLKYGIQKDGNINGRKDELIVTCIDHITDYQYIANGVVIDHKNLEDFLNGIGSFLGIDSVSHTSAPWNENID